MDTRTNLVQETTISVSFYQSNQKAGDKFSTVLVDTCMARQIKLRSTRYDNHLAHPLPFLTGLI